MHTNGALYSGPLNSVKSRGYAGRLAFCFNVVGNGVRFALLGYSLKMGTVLLSDYNIYKSAGFFYRSN